MASATAPVRIRESRRDETEAIERLTLMAYEEFAAPMTPEVWAGYRGNVVEAVRARAPQERLVAEAAGGGPLLGSVLLLPAAPAAAGGDEAAGPEARLLAVDPAARGRGIGTALMTECVARARQAGATELRLHTTDLMRAAVRMYTRMGFVRAPEDDFSPAPGFLVKGYRLDLAARRPAEEAFDRGR